MGLLKVYCVSYGGNSVFAEELRPIINELQMKLVTVNEWDTADVKWDKDTWLSELKKADIVVCRSDYRL
jgi:arginyl-tRNA synthetase